MSTNLGKYKGVIISIALFLLLDASVLMINFYTSFQISKDAIAVNLAGRQRMLSQRTMKSLLDMQISQDNKTELERSTTELSNVVTLFNRTLYAFDRGGTVQGTGSGTELIEAVTTEKARLAVSDTNAIWQPFFEKLSQTLALDASDPSYQSLLTEAIAVGKASNLTILKQMNNLTVEMEAVAKSKARRLRIIQTVGISLAILNFFIIMVHFLRQLKDSDEKVAVAKKQTDDILETVDQGLFLLDEDLRISHQHSNELARIFGSSDIGGRRFTEFLKGMVSATDLNNVERFFKLLFDPRKKQRLLGDLNPLKQVAIQIPNGENGHINKHIKFAFSRVGSKDGAPKVLTAVSDITQEVQLAMELEKVKGRNDQQLAMISVLLNSPPNLVPLFLQSSAHAYDEINRLLKRTSHSHQQYLQKARDIFAQVHNIKGESSALNLDIISDLCHDFEQKIKDIQHSERIEGNSFLPLTIMLNDMMTYTDLLETLYLRMNNKTKEKAPVQATSHNNWKHLDSLANTIAKRKQKNVEVTLAGMDLSTLSPNLAVALNSISVQLIRNAVTHGIEPEPVRISSGKPAKGLVALSLAVRQNGDFRFTVSDDGAGINRNKLLAGAISQGRITERQASMMTLKNIGNLMFEPQVSQTKLADKDSGQGVGLYSVKQLVRQLGGTISLKQAKHQGVTFIITIPAAANQPRKAA